MGLYVRVYTPVHISPTFGHLQREHCVTSKEMLKTFRLLITNQLELIRNYLYRFICNIHSFVSVDPRWYTTTGYRNSQENDIMTIMTILPQLWSKDTVL